MNELLRRAGEDPQSLDLADRHRLASAMRHAQKAWLPLLRQLVEPPEPTEEFPAFLLEAPAFGDLRESIARQNQEHGKPPRLDTATADTLQRFVDLFRHYLAEVDEPTRLTP